MLVERALREEGVERAALGRDPRRVCGVVEALVNATGLAVWRAALARAPGDASRLYARTIV